MMKHGIVESNCAICRSNSLVRESINGWRQNRCMRVLYLAIPVGTDCDDHEQKDLYHEATYDAQPKPLFVSETNERHQSRSTYWNTEKHSPCKKIFGDSNNSFIQEKLETAPSHRHAGRKQRGTQTGCRRCSRRQG
jgi:hypothetical protein